MYTSTNNVNKLNRHRILLVIIPKANSRYSKMFYDSGEAIFIIPNGCNFYISGEDIFPKRETASCTCVLSQGRGPSKQI